MERPGGREIGGEEEEGQLLGSGVEEVGVSAKLKKNRM